MSLFLGNLFDFSFPFWFGYMHIVLLGSIIFKIVMCTKRRALAIKFV